MPTMPRRTNKWRDLAYRMEIGDSAICYSRIDANSLVRALSKAGARGSIKQTKHYFLVSRKKMFDVQD